MVPPPVELDESEAEPNEAYQASDLAENGSAPDLFSLPATQSRPFGGGTVEMTRTALYTIGGLIVGVAVLAFLLGWSFGSEMGTQRQSVNSSPRTVSGQIHYATKQGRKASDSEAVVIAWPTSRKPDEKLDVAGLRPNVAPAKVPKSTVHAIRSLGGDFARTDRNGVYELELPAAGEYYLLVISNHVSRPAGQQPTTVEVIEIGQFVTKATELLSVNDYVWSKQIVAKPTTFNHVFGAE